MALIDTPDDAQASSEGDGQDSSEPPNGDRKPFIASPPESAQHNGVAMPVMSAQFLGKNSQPHPLANGHTSHTQSSSSPFPPELSSHFGESGNSHRDLRPLVVPPHQVGASRSTTTSTTPSPTSSPSPSESNPWSPPPTAPPSRPPSQAPSRAASMSDARPDLSSLLTSPALPNGSRAVPVTPVEASPVPRSKGTPSVHSNDGGHRFNLKDLLGSAPKLSRKSSARSSASSRKSDSEGGPKSTAGESVGLLKKYGTCERVAIGKGATSVVRLAHKWDRSEEKLYAVKVIIFLILPDFCLYYVGL